MTLDDLNELGSAVLRGLAQVPIVRWVEVEVDILRNLSEIVVGVLLVPRPIFVGLGLQREADLKDTSNAISLSQPASARKDTKLTASWDNQ
jgi:hypothetical protein